MWLEIGLWWPIIGGGYRILTDLADFLQFGDAVVTDDVGYLLFGTVWHQFGTERLSFAWFLVFLRKDEREPFWI